MNLLSVNIVNKSYHLMRVNFMPRPVLRNIHPLSYLILIIV